MQIRIPVLLILLFSGFGTGVLATDSSALPDPMTVVSKFFDALKAGDVESVDSISFRIPEIDDNPEAWFSLIVKVSGMINRDQLDWEVVCSKELSSTAVVIANQTLKYGRKHGDPDPVFLVKDNGNWLLLPDVLATNARERVRAAMTEMQLSEKRALEKWALSEIRGLSSDCATG